MEHKAKIESYSVKENVVNENDHAYSGVTSLEFKYKIRRKKDLKSGKAILKIPSLANLPSEELIASEKLFKREVYFYQIILPELYRLGQCAPFAPKLYAATSANALVLEDLRGDGFKPTDQKHWLNLNECRVSLEVLATYHALGYKYLRSSRKKDPQSLIKLSPSFGPDNDSVLQFYEAIQSSLNGELLDKVYELSKELINRHVKYPPENSMTVLIHGDFRTSNIFLKYNGDNQVSEAKIIDWQFSVEGNPVLDLIVFFINSVSIEMIENNDDVLLNFYLEKLNTKLASLDNLADSKDLITALNQFVDNFQMKYEAKIESYRVADNVASVKDHGYSGVASLEFEYKIRGEKDSRLGKAIMKIPSLAPLSSETLIQCQKMFKREVHFYKIILPELYRLGQCAPFAPELYAATSANALVLEDLRVNGFKPTDQKRWLNLDECRVSLEVLATYHALGYKYLQSSSKNDPQSLIKLLPFFRPDDIPIRTFYDTIQSHLRGELDLLNKIYALANELLSMNEIYPPKNSMTVLIHGDYRSSNIFLKYNSDNQVSEAKIIDWQLSKESNPVLDLIFFFINSVSIEMIEIYDDALLDFYLKKLNTKLASLDTNCSYNKPELIANIIHYKHYYFSTLCRIFLVTYLKPRGGETDYTIPMAVKWLSYLNKKEII
ncbi:hypothetical protein V9T40_001653 [Parthenolecanium corni]|uniref:CHK kinase-like domain-containing protein n=1 Tax=Parthenolecanium corni TaxID=536013 RepID=A0AAN9TMZ8_9HEMI